MKGDERRARQIENIEKNPRTQTIIRTSYTFLPFFSLTNNKILKMIQSKKRKIRHIYKKKKKSWTSSLIQLI